MKNFKISATTLFLICLSIAGLAQGESQIRKTIIDINKSLDEAVVSKDTTYLNQFYGDDFVFTHGTGTIDSKRSWINEIKKPHVQFVSRVHDSTAVELHGNVALLTGRLTVTRKAEQGMNQYTLKYIRLYSLRRKGWQLISHRTIEEKHY